MSKPQNTAVWLESPKQKPLSVKESPYTLPDAGEVLVKTAAFGINPVENKIQDMNLFELPTPIILGSEAAGEIVAVGDGVDDLQVGQRVMGVTLGTGTKQTKHGGFQTYTVINAALVAPIPTSLSFTSAVALPIGISTAAAGLFNPTHFGLPLPTNPPAAGKHPGVLILWGGSSCVGLNALQLAKAAGIEVFAVAGQQNHALCQKLGASATFDHKDPSVIAQIVEATKGKKVLGVFDVIAQPATEKASVEVLTQIADAEKLVVVTVPPFAPFDTKGVELRPVFGASILQTGIADRIWHDFLPTALERGTIVPVPEVQVAGTGLGEIQKALDVCKQGYSAKKIVVQN